MFSVGDKVVCIESNGVNNSNIHVGDVGIVCDATFSGVFAGIYGVDWGHDVDGHDCMGTCAFGNGWNVYGSRIKLLSEDDDFDIATSDIDQLLFSV